MDIITNPIALQVLQFAIAVVAQVVVQKGGTVHYR